MAIVTVGMVLARGTLEYLRGARSARALAARSFFRKHSSRMHGWSRSLRTAVKWYLNLGRLVWQRRPAGLSPGAPLIIGSSVGESEIDEFRAYVRDLDGHDRCDYINRLRPPNECSLPERVLLFCFVSLFWVTCLPVFFVAPIVFARIGQMVEVALILQAVGRSRPSRTYLFTQYDGDANLLAYLLRHEAGSPVTRIPSPNPLFSYAICICDEFVFTSPAQIREAEKFADTWRVGSRRLWKPPLLFRVVSATEARVGECAAPAAPEGRPRPPYVLGFLSSGFWQRRERNHRLDRKRSIRERAEYLLLEQLAAALKRNPDISLLVFPHPLEKEEAAIYEDCCDYYRRQFGGLSYSLVDRGTGTFARCGEADLLVSAVSSVVAEALFLGYKAVYAPLLVPEEEFDFGPAAIRIHDPDEFEPRIRELLAMAPAEFFRVCGVSEYRYDAFQPGMSFLSAANGQALAMSCESEARKLLV